MNITDNTFYSGGGGIALSVLGDVTFTGCKIVGPTWRQVLARWRGDHGDFAAARDILVLPLPGEVDWRRETGWGIRIN